MSKYESGWTLQQKVELVSRLARDGRLSDVQYRVAVVLILYFHNTTTGECFPSYKQLAAASGVSRWSAMRATHKLREVGVITFEESSGGRCRRNNYKLVKSSPSAPFNDEKLSPQRTPAVAPAHPLGSSPSAPAYIQGIYPGRKSEALPSPLKRASASPKKRNGLQGKTLTKAETKPQPTEETWTVTEIERAKNLRKLLKVNGRPPNMAPAEVAKETVLEDLKQHLGTEAYLKAIELVEDEFLTRCAGIETRRPGQGWFTLAAMSGYQTATEKNGRMIDADP